ncbi:MAG: hemerythrin domain-containing protein [Clostridium sp.]
MNSINTMINEHKNIKQMIKVIRNLSLRILDNKYFEVDDFYRIIDFIRSYADKYHHGKEEDILFKYMVEEGGEVANKMITYGMLLDHDLGRMYVKGLEDGVNSFRLGNLNARLDIIANAISYSNLLESHIEKEDNVAYTYGQRILSNETMDKIEKESRQFNNKHSDVEEKYIKLIEELEKKYK